jgi:hypothetical protein
MRLLGAKTSLSRRLISVSILGLPRAPSAGDTFRGDHEPILDPGLFAAVQEKLSAQAVETGPDVLWRHGPSKSGVVLEAKTNKKPGSQYQKRDDIGQFYDHLAFLRKKYPGESFFQAITGPMLPVSDESNPPDELRILPLEGFQELVGRVEEMFNFIESATDSDAAEVKVERWLQTLGLSWPQCFESLPYNKICKKV